MKMGEGVIFPKGTEGWGPLLGSQQGCHFPHRLSTSERHSLGTEGSWREEETDGP